MTTLQITLPDDLARDLAEAGLLDSRALEAVLRERLRAVRIAGFWKLRAAVAADPMTDDEINAEIAACRIDLGEAAIRVPANVSLDRPAFSSRE